MDCLGKRKGSAGLGPEGGILVSANQVLSLLGPAEMKESPGGYVFDDPQPQERVQTRATADCEQIQAVPSAYYPNQEPNKVSG